MTPQHFIVLGLLLDILGVLFLSAGLLSGRKGQLAFKKGSLIHNKKLWEELASGYDKFKESPPEYIEECKSEVNEKGQVILQNMEDDIRQREAELENYSFWRELIGILMIFVGFTLQLVGALAK